MAGVFRRCFGAAWWLALALSVAAGSPGRQVLPGHRPECVSRLSPIGNMADETHLNLAIGLPLRNQDVFRQLLRDLYDPSSPRYRKFLKPRQWAGQFGPSETDYQALIDFAAAHHFQVVHTHSNRLLLDVTASVAEVREAFHVNMKEYRHPTEGRTFYAPDTEPSVDLDVPLLHISGLDNYILPHPLVLPWSGAPQTGSGPNGTYFGSDFRAAYAPGVTLTGAGQTLALVEFDTYYTNDILNYENAAGLSPPVPVTNVLIDGFSGPPKGDDNEVSVDIELAAAMAPGLSRLMVYEAPQAPASAGDDMLNRMATDDAANQISCSWLFEINAETDQIFQEMAAQGQSFFSASGDFGAYAQAMGPMQADPFITQVGGTVLTTGAATNTWKSETAWKLTSGGVGATVPIPYWQLGINMSSNQGSTLWRNMPDVAMVAEAICLYDYNGLTNAVTGTSCSTPLWAGFMALVNQQAVQNGNPPVGFANPAIYAIGQGSLYGSCFHDTKTGNNTNAVSTNKYFAVAGYDLCTGWGTPTGQALINALTPPDNLIALPAGGLFFALTHNNTAAGGAQILTLTNSGSTPLAWALGAGPAWLEFSAANGLLTADAATNLTVTLSEAATNTPPGGYDVVLALSNLTSGVTHTVPIFLAVSDPLTISPAAGLVWNAPAGGPFSVTSQTISLSNAAAASLQLAVNANSSFVNVAPSGGTLSPGAADSVTVNLTPNAANLLINAAGGGITFADASTGFTQTVPFMVEAGNGGFETGDFSNWTFTGNTNANFVGGGLFSPYIHSGSFAAVMGEPTNLATLSQSFPSAPDQLYQLSFWLNNPVGGRPNDFQATCNGATLFAQTNMPQFSWTNMQYIIAATGDSTRLEFFFLNAPDAFGFDDVTVTPIPPPAFSSVAVSNGSVFFSWTAPPPYFCQLQYKTNLSSAAWVNVGGPMAATNGTVTAVDVLPDDPQRFYRVVMAVP